MDRVDEDRPPVLEVRDHRHADDPEDELDPRVPEARRRRAILRYRCGSHTEVGHPPPEGREISFKIVQAENKQVLGCGLQQSRAPGPAIFRAEDQDRCLRVVGIGRDAVVEEPVRSPPRPRRRRRARPRPACRSPCARSSSTTSMTQLREDHRRGDDRVPVAQDQGVDAIVLAVRAGSCFDTSSAARRR